MMPILCHAGLKRIYIAVITYLYKILSIRQDRSCEGGREGVWFNNTHISPS